ncbi:P-selectin-like isoform X2 [Halichondria panicea]|uniref:P-selectin-like isoform X2 n=1 Tax=Halichondria panicea TaxID=6063 RepID=UPI00312B8FD8
MNNELLATRIMRMFPSRLFLCCLLGSASLVYGQQALTGLAASNEFGDGTDHTGEIISFTDVGSGASGTPRPWLCFTEDTGSVLWLFPNGSALQLESRVLAVEDEVFIRDVPDFGVVLHRGPAHFSPDGEHCCVRTATNERRCVTFTPCPTLSPLSNGMISYDATTNMATYTCDTGYTISGATPITCMSDGTSAGTWSPSPPTCTIVTCPVLTSPTNGGVSTTPSRDYLTFAAYSCDPGYFLTSSATRHCEATGQWSGVAPTCSPVDCGALMAPSNGAVDTSSGTTFMMTATYTCNTGYNIVGSESRTCGASITNGPTGVWSPAAPVCEIVNCGSLEAPSNGAVSTSSGTTFMMTATYTCNPGYTLIGANTRTCGGDGQWTPVAPTCLQLVISPRGVPMAGQSFSLTCSLSGGASLQPTLSYQWTREGESLMTSTATLNFDTLN